MLGEVCLQKLAEIENCFSESVGVLFRRLESAHKISLFENRQERLLGESLATCSYVKILCSQRGMSFRRIRLTHEIKLITTPFLSGLGYGPVRVGV